MDSAQCRSIIPYAHRNTLDENEMNFKNNSKLAQNGIQFKPLKYPLHTQLSSKLQLKQPQ